MHIRTLTMWFMSSPCSNSSPISFLTGPHLIPRQHISRVTSIVSNNTRTVHLTVNCDHSVCRRCQLSTQYLCR